MSKPCNHIHESNPDCRICFWCEDCSEKGRAYRKRWGVPEPDCGPGILRRVWNFTKAVVTHAATGAKKAAPDVVAQRLALCVVCEHYDAERQICKHASCGCFVRLKAQWAEQKCPIEKW